jgi:hypothetical protein
MNQPNPDAPRGPFRRHLVDVLVVLSVFVVLGAVVLAYVWLSGGSGFDCTLPHQVLGHC